MTKLHTAPKKGRNPLREYPAQTRQSTPVTFNGHNAYPDDVRSFMAEWSRAQAEANHVETLEEANDFGIQAEEDDDFMENLTVYEMHEIPEIPAETPAADSEQLDVESNETSDQGAASTPPDHEPHDQSAPVD